MGLFAKAPKGDFEPAPVGLHNAVCVDVVDLGLKDTQFGPKHKLRIVFQLDATLGNGKRALVNGQFTLSSSEKSTLRQFVEAWRGRSFASRREFEMFNEEKLVGQSAMVSVIHRAKGDDIYANINGVFPAKVQMVNDGSYVRVKDRPADGQQHQQQAPKPAQAPQRSYAGATTPATNPSSVPESGADGDQDVPF